MCGLVTFYARESVIDYKHLDTLFSWSEKRGRDGFGYVIIRKNDDGIRKIFSEYRNSKSYSECKDEVKKTIEAVNGLKIGDLIIAISRACPETEGKTDSVNLIRTMQPIYSEEHDLVVVHNGAVSNSILQNLKNMPDSTYKFTTNIDSEAILAAYVLKQRNMKDTMELLSGGFAAIMYDERKDMLYVMNDFKPIAHGYVRGVGFFLHSDNDALGEVIQNITGCTRDGVAMWETWYHHYLSGGRIKEIDLDSGFMRNIKYSPRFITQQWDSNFGIIVKPTGNTTVEHIDAEVLTSVMNHVIKERDKDDNSLCLVAASGGLDSSLTLATLKLAGYKNIVACHFNYGHRGSDAEEMAIKNVCKELDITCKIFDLKSLISEIDTTSMLIDKNAKITTGTKEGLKQLDAWVNLRNTQFLTWMATYAEAQVMKYDYKTVYFLGGFLNLSESGHYPDNSEYFIQTFIEHLKYGSLIGNRIKPLYGLSNLMKHELFVMIKEFELEKVYRHTISCDRPIVESRNSRLRDVPNQSKDEIPRKEWVVDNIPCNCMKNGIPACGSGLLSYWGSKMVGMDDMKLRNFYEVKDSDYEAYIPEHIKSKFSKNPNIYEIIDRILLPEDKLNVLRLNMRILKGGLT